MKIIELDNRIILDSFIGQQEHSQFLQSWQWGEIQIKAGNKIRRWGVIDNEELVATATVLIKDLLMGKKYFFCPGGPVVKLKAENEKFKIIDFLLAEIEKNAKTEKVIFFRFEPEFEIGNPKFKIAKSLDIQPAKTSILDLSKIEEQLLAAMHPKTRYNIRLAEKKGVKVRAVSADDFDYFWQIAAETSQRDGFRLHNREYYRQMLSINSDFIKLFIAELDDSVIAANIVSFFGDTVTYLHGASGNKFREAMAPYALQWKCIRLAKQMKYKYYDFFGIDEKKWPGVTRFKNGFNGQALERPGTLDLVFDKYWYDIYKILRWVRRKI